MTSLEELEQESFKPEEFIDRLVWRTLGSQGQEKFEPRILAKAFQQTISDLKASHQVVESKVNQLKEEWKLEEAVHSKRVISLEEHNTAAFNHFKALDERINFVATKVVHLGDQLEGVNTPRTRAAEAETLIQYYTQFKEGNLSPIFRDPDQVLQAASIIQKLHVVAQELPLNQPIFEVTSRRITDKYEEIEHSLISQFKSMHHNQDVSEMKKIATTLMHFKGFSHCVEAFIEECQKEAFLRADIFEDIPPLVAKTNKLIGQVFQNTEVVMSKFIMNLYNNRLQSSINKTLSNHLELKEYLKKLSEMYLKTVSLSNHLSSYKISSDPFFLQKVTKSIFSKHLDTYVSSEEKCLREKCDSLLQRYYSACNHSKRNVNSSGIHDLRRDLQSMIGTKTNLNLGPTIENFGGEIFLSQELAINLLQELKVALHRCQLLSSRAALPANATSLFQILLTFLCKEHIDYAVELSLKAIPLADSKVEPEIYFLDVVVQANTIFHLFEKQFSDLIPLVSSSPKHVECLALKRDVMESMENKIDQGLDRTLAAMVGWVRHMLATEQKRSDYKPDGEVSTLAMFSPACGKVVKYIDVQREAISMALDGKNVGAVLMEFGTRLHHVIHEHFLTFQYNSMGAMLAICDVNEYRQCVKKLEIAVVSQQFDILHCLCNLLVVKPENIKTACLEEQLAGLDKSVLLSFVQLRSDYRSAKLSSFLK